MQDRTMTLPATVSELCKTLALFCLVLAVLGSLMWMIDLPEEGSTHRQGRQNCVIDVQERHQDLPLHRLSP
jgi:hypothetical protein